MGHVGGGGGTGACWRRDGFGGSSTSWILSPHFKTSPLHSLEICHQNDQHTSEDDQAAFQVVSKKYFYLPPQILYLPPSSCPMSLPTLVQLSATIGLGQGHAVPRSR